jgi:phosphoglycolate phosphatase
MQSRTLIFDLDGTIQDPSVGIANSTNFALRYFDYEAVGMQRITQCIGPPLEEVFLSLVGELPQDRLMQLVDKYRERYSETGYAECRLYGDVRETIEDLSRAGHDLRVCTSKRLDFAVRILELHGLTSSFSDVSGGDVGVRKADQLAKMIERGLDLRHAVMIGDRAVDIYAARANAMASVGVLWGFGGLPILRRLRIPRGSSQ